MKPHFRVPNFFAVILVFILFTLVALVISGCSQAPTVTELGAVAVSYQGAVTGVYDIITPKGVQCVVATGRGSGISCNWPQRELVPYYMENK